jgi:hypothetical protein
MKLVPAVFALLLAACASAPPQPNPALHDELIAMKNADQAIRKKALADKNNETLKTEWKAVDAKNLARLKQILDANGWPTVAQVGKDGVGAAWTLSQHGDPEFLHRVLPMMKKSVDAGELSGGLYATSLDRVRIQDKQLQVYGTQFDTQNGKCAPLPMEDPAHVDERRKEVGLGPLSEYTEQLCKVYGLTPTKGE